MTQTNLVTAHRLLWLGLGLCLVSCLGCAQGQLAAGPASVNQAAAADAQLAAQMQDLNSRIARFDADNTQLHSEVARLQQQLGVEHEEKILIKEQLAATTRELQQVRVARAETDQRLTALQTSSQFKGGATITANNSLVNKLQVVEISGLDVRQDADLIRIELPSDQIFNPGRRHALEGCLDCGRADRDGGIGTFGQIEIGGRAHDQDEGHDQIGHA